MSLAKSNKDSMIRSLNLAKLLFQAGSVTQLDRIEKIQHRQVISDEVLKRAINLYKATEEEKYKSDVNSYNTKNLDQKSSNNNAGGIIIENSINSEDECESNSVIDSSCDNYD